MSTDGQDAGSCPVTGQIGEQRGPLKHCSCGTYFWQGKWNQEYCSPRCRNRSYNASHPVTRQKVLTFGAPAIGTPTHREQRAALDRRESRKARMLARLRQGEATTWELLQLGGAGFSSRLKELRREGHRITCENRLEYAVYSLEAGE